MLVGFAASVSFLIAWAHGQPTIEQLRFLRDLPRASLDAPKKGPAIYAGRIYGPPGRATPMGEKAAITWWWVNDGFSKSRTTSCFERQLESLELAADGRSVPYVALGSASSLSLLSDERGDDWGDPVVVDLGSQAAHKPDYLPDAAHKCSSGTNPIYVERWVAQGAEVEVVACYRDGALRECDAPLRSLLGLGTIVPHRQRRADHAYVPFLVACGINTVMLLGFLLISGLVTLPLRPTRRPT